jgi:hypothetical protein
MHLTPESRSPSMLSQSHHNPFIPAWHLIKYNDAFHLHDIGTTEQIPWGGILPWPASDRDRPSIPLETESFEHENSKAMYVSELRSLRWIQNKSDSEMRH